VQIFKVVVRNLIIGFIALTLLCSDILPPGDKTERVRAFTRMDEFDFVTWTLDAFFVKGSQFALETERSISEANQKKLVLEYLSLVQQIDDVKAKIDTIYSDPNVTDARITAAPLVAELNRLQAQFNLLAPVCESILEQQTTYVLAQLGLTVGGQPLPPVLYHVTPLPKSLIVSPRDHIQQDQNIPLPPELTIEQMVALETRVEKALNVSALVEDVGGVGTYPTMVMSTNDLPYLTDTIAHEWTHNYLTLRPLGLNYETSPELRTMNETTASISGGEVGRMVLEKYYPEFLPPPPQPEKPQGYQPPAQDEQEQPLKFDFRKEMHATRVHVDDLLAAGKINEAEQYMNQRRIIFWNNGYQIRRLNQAYFAFNGAYADEPGGAAGNDPVGPAVRKLRQQSTSLAQFLNRISRMTSFDELLKATQ
jgi:hypothetical protein